MSKLGEALSRADVPMREEAIDRAVALVQAVVAPAPEPQPARLPSLRWLVAGAAVVLALAITPPGRSAVSWAAELVGLASEPTKESPLGPSAQEAVIGSGETPNGTAYEVVASTEVPPVGDTTRRITCVRLDLIGVREIRSLTCETNSMRSALAERKLMPRAVLSPSLGERGLVIQGLATVDVTEAEIVHRDEGGKTTSYPVEVFELQAPVSDEIDAVAPLKYVVGFIPSSLVPARTPSTPAVPLPRIRPSHRPWLSPEGSDPVRAALDRIAVVAYDEVGEAIGRETLDSPNAALTLYPPLYHQPRTSEPRVRDR